MSELHSPPSLPYPPRYFWRRLAALLVDLIVASLLASLLSYPLFYAGVKFAPFGFRYFSCAPAESWPENLMPLPTEHKLLGLGKCRISGLGAPPMTTMVAQFEGDSPNHRFTFTIGVNAEGTALEPRHDSGLLIFAAMIALSGFLLSRGRRSPGKAMLGLRVIGEGRRFYLRETLKLAPAILLSLLWLLGSFAAMFVAPEQLEALARGAMGFVTSGQGRTAFLLLWLCTTGLTLWWYDWLMLRWRGQIRHDRICNMAVVRG